MVARPLLVGAVVSIVVVAVGGIAVGGAWGDAAAVSPARTVRSADGWVVVSIPRGAMRTVVPIRVRTLTRASYPRELRGAKFRPGTKIYALEPDGLTFLKPVTITKRFDKRFSGFDPKDGLPGIVLTSRDRKGKWEILGSQAIRWAGPSTLVVSGTTRHFSTLVSIDDLVRLTFRPVTVELSVGGSFRARIEATATNNLTDISIETPKWNPIGSDVLRFDGQATRGEVATADYTCIKPGTSDYGAQVEVTDSSIGGILLAFLGRPADWTFVVSGAAVCKGGPPPAAVTVTSACVDVVHKAYSTFPSYLRWLFAFVSGTLPASPRVEVTATGVNGGQPFSAAINPATGRAEAIGGISSYGAKQTQKIAVNGVDITKQVVAKLGTAAPEVTSAQTVIAGTCP